MKNSLYLCGVKGYGLKFINYQKQQHYEKATKRHDQGEEYGQKSVYVYNPFVGIHCRVFYSRLLLNMNHDRLGISTKLFYYYQK